MHMHVERLYNECESIIVIELRQVHGKGDQFWDEWYNMLGGVPDGGAVLKFRKNCGRVDSMHARGLYSGIF